MGQRLGGEHLDGPVERPPGEVGRPLAAAVCHHDGATRPRRGECRRGGMRHMVADEPEPARVEARQDGLQEEAGPACIEGAQPLPGLRRQIRARWGLGRVVGVGDGIKVFGLQPRPLQAPCSGLLGQLPGGERHGRLAVLAAGETLLLRSRHDAAIHDKGRRWVVEHGVDAQDSHSA